MGATIDLDGCVEMCARKLGGRGEGANIGMPGIKGRSS
jgi:hypothetical protein